MDTLVSPNSEIVGKEIKVLDHGHIRLVDYMGSDAAIVQAARVSYGPGTKSKNEDAALIRYLMRHDHATPFEMVNLKFHVKAPIFVFRQWHRHRTASINEISARYSIIGDEFYVPSEDQCRKQSKKNKQGGEDIISQAHAQAIRKHMDEDQKYLYEKYLIYAQDSGNDSVEPNKLRDPDTSIDFEDYSGIAREIARNNLPVSIYSEMYWTCNLRNIFGFLKLRMDSHAQYEIRVYADAMFEIVKEICPIASQAFLDYQLNAKKFSAQELDAIQDLLSSPCDSKFTKDHLVAEYKFSKREADEFIEYFNLKG